MEYKKKKISEAEQVESSILSACKRICFLEFSVNYIKLYKHTTDYNKYLSDTVRYLYFRNE